MNNNNIIIDYQNFMLELNSRGNIDKERLARNFKLDIETVIQKDGMYIVQGDKIIKRPFDVSLSSRKINELEVDHPIGFSDILYAENASSLYYKNPPEQIPDGCWCTIQKCGEMGPFGHNNSCTNPNRLSLCLTLKGFVECIYSSDKSYRNRLINNADTNIKSLVEDYMNEVSKLSKGKKVTDSIYIEAANNVNKKYDFIKSKKSSSTRNYLTNIRYQSIRNIPGLKNGKINYFHGATIIRYSNVSNGVPRHNSIRVYESGTITVYSCEWDKNKTYINIINNIYNRINESGQIIVPENAMIAVADASFRLVSEQSSKAINLDTLYRVFSPVDDYGNPLDRNDYMYSKEFVYEDGSKKIRNFVREGDNEYIYTISEEGRGKLSMTFSKFENNDTTGYMVTSQIYNTGIVQLTFSYVDDNAKSIERKIIAGIGKDSNDIFEKVEYQLDNISEYFKLVKNYIVYVVNKMIDDQLDILIEKEVNKKSEKVFNVVPGVMPFGKKKNMYIGYVVDIFDDTNEEWESNYWWSTNDSERGVIVEIVKTNDKILYGIIVGNHRKLKILHDNELSSIKFNKLTEAPIVYTNDSNQNDKLYLIEQYDPDNELHWVTSGKIHYYTLQDLRIHKQSINDPKVYVKDTQVCDKTKDGIDIRPNPYSFYGSCPGGLSQYIDRVGVQSRKDNKFYPTCVKVTDSKSTHTTRNRLEVENEIIEFIMNGLTPQQMERAGINPNIETFVHGIKINDKYAGTFKPGTIDIGKVITFWDEQYGTWTEGVLVDYIKSHGLGNDLNHTSFVIQRDNDNTCDCVSDRNKRDTSGCLLHVEVRGEDFHPKHRENRNFPGLRRLLPNEESRKELLINCAKKLNLIKQDIQIEEVEKNTAQRVLKQIGRIDNSTFSSPKGSGSFLSIARGIIPFIDRNITNLTKRPYLSVIIPDDTIRCILYIMDKSEQYLIDTSDKVRRVNVTFDTNYDLLDTIIDGYITEDSSYYPVDLISFGGKNVVEEYIYNDDYGNPVGRLIRLQELLITNVTQSGLIGTLDIKNPLGTYGKRMLFKDTIAPKHYIGPIYPEVSLPSFIKENRRPNSNILFIPIEYNRSYIIWKHNIPNNYIVIQLLKKGESKDSWIVGLTEETKEGLVKHWKLLKMPLILSKVKDINGHPVTFKRGDYVKLRLNVMPNGLINENDPYVQPTKVNKADSRTFEETRIDINLVTKSINERVFNEVDRWVFSKIQKVYVPGESSRDPMIEIEIS